MFEPKQSLNQDWFEMKDIRRRKLDKSVWIPLRTSVKILSGKFAYEGYKEEFFGAGSLAVPIECVEYVKELEWMDIGISHDHRGYVDNGSYYQADIYQDSRGKIVGGIYLVLEQLSDEGKPSIWHLHQDLVITLGLIREENSWVCPKDDYVEVAKIGLNDRGKPTSIEIKAEYLKDYLCARNMALYITSYYSRDFIMSDRSHIDWPENGKIEDANGRWEGRVMEIHEGNGEPFGAKMFVSHYIRTDVDDSDDVPSLSMPSSDDNIDGNSWERSFQGKKLYRVIGDYWMNEIIEPGKISPKVRKDKLEINIEYKVDADGATLKSKDLRDSGRWLWFKPDVISALIERRGGTLKFYTAQTGKVAGAYGYGVHFGVNQLGLINIYAEDISWFPEWHQKIWAAHNVTPEGGVSTELLDSHVRSDPADSQAPESFLSSTINKINCLANEKLNIQLFKNHESIPEIMKKIHRFRTTDLSSLCALAKDIARVTADSLDTAAMQKIVSPPKGETWRSLKSLENLLTSKYVKDEVKKIMSPLFGVYDLRLADAHLPGSETDEAFKHVGINANDPYVFQAYSMLHNVVVSLCKIADLLQKWDSEPQL